MTNGAMIRSMTDVELANFFATDAVIVCALQCWDAYM